MTLSNTRAPKHEGSDSNSENNSYRRFSLLITGRLRRARTRGRTWSRLGAGFVVGCKLRDGWNAGIENERVLVRISRRVDPQHVGRRHEAVSDRPGGVQHECMFIDASVMDERLEELVPRRLRDGARISAAMTLLR